MTRRTQQMGEFLREEVTDIIRSEVDDPRLGFWTVTRVEVPPDMRSARIYVSVLGTDGERKETHGGAAGRGGVHPRSSASRACAPAPSPTSISATTAPWSTPMRSTVPYAS